MSTTTTTDADDRSTVFDATAPRRRWEAFADRLAAVVEECVVDVAADGLHADATGPATVARVDCTLGADGFDAYHGPDGPDAIGVNLERFGTVLDLADADEAVRVALDDETRAFHIAGDGFEYALAGIDPDAIRDGPDDVDLDLSSALTIGAGRLARAVGGADVVSDHCALGYDPDGAVVYVSGEGDVDDVRFAWGADDCERLDAPAEAVESFLSVEYLGALLGSLDDDAPATVRFDDEQPVEIDQPFADGAGACTFMQAPRIRSR